MKKHLLSDLECKKAKIKEKNYQLGDQKGLYLFVKTNGSKLWQMRYVSPTTKRRNILSLGRYPEISLSQSRQARDEYRKQIANGIDPLENKRMAKQKIIREKNGLCENLIDEWLEKESLTTKAITHKSKSRILNKDIKPYLKNMHIKDVSTEHVIDIISKKQSVAPEIASRLFMYLDNIFRYAVLKKYCDRNILADVRKKIL